MLKLDGKAVSEVRRRLIADRAAKFSKSQGRAPGLAVILVGDDPASQVYVRNKVSACQSVGIHSEEHRLAASSDGKTVAALIQRLNLDSKTDGILLQLPLPRRLDGDQLINLIDPEKDPDGLTLDNMGRLYAGKPRTVSCTPLGIMKIFEHYAIHLAGRHAVVVGRSAIVGKPMAQLLLQADATVTICHSKTRDLERLTHLGEIVVVAAGRPEFLGLKAFQQGAVVVDVGIHRLNLPDGKTKLVGDVKIEGLEGHVSALTPVPGGVGPMTITMLLENTMQLAEARINN